MIQIIAGTFGYYDGRKVIPITNASGPQELDPGLEARLVRNKIARYVDATENIPARCNSGAAVPDGAVTPEAGAAPDGAVTPEAGAVPDGAATPEAGAAPDGAVTPEAGAVPDGAVTPEAGAAPDGAGSDVDGLPTYNAKMRLDDLKEIAKLYGVDASAMRKRTDIVDAIDAVGKEEDEDEEPPSLGAMEPL